MEQNNNESKGALIGSIIIVLMLIIGGIYFAKQAGQNIASSEIDQVLEADPELQAIEDSENSDELPELESDLDSINVDDLEANDAEDLEF